MSYLDEISSRSYHSSHQLMEEEEEEVVVVEMEEMEDLQDLMDNYQYMVVDLQVVLVEVVDTHNQKNLDQ